MSVTVTNSVFPVASTRSTLATGAGAALAGVQPPLRNSDPARALRRLTDTDLLYAPTQTAFVSQVSNTLGSFGTSNDGFDSILTAPLAAFNADVAAIPGLDANLADMDFADGDFDASTWSPMTTQVQSFNDAGDVLLGAAIGTFTPPGATAPGGGGGGGGGTTPPPAGGAGVGAGAGGGSTAPDGTGTVGCKRADGVCILEP